eukprot:12903698-Prorocentrum_lima.AAC.1
MKEVPLLALKDSLNSWLEDVLVCVSPENNCRRQVWEVFAGEAKTSTAAEKMGASVQTFGFAT